MEMSLYRALALRKSTKQRIEKEIGSVKFVETTVGTSGTVSGISVASVEKTIQGNYDRIQALFENFNKLNKAITAANAGVTKDSTSIKTTVVNGEKMTLADIIQAKTYLHYMNMLLKAMSNQLTKAKMKIEMSAQIVSDRCDAFLANMGGGDKATLSKDDVAAYSKQFHDNNDLRLVDPIGLENVVNDLCAKLEDFAVEIDARNSELNASTIIDVDIK